MSNIDKEINFIASWVPCSSSYPEDDLEVMVHIDYSVGTKMSYRQHAMMYRKNNSWYFVGTNNECRGKYITHWLDCKNDPFHK